MDIPLKAERMDSLGIRGWGVLVVAASVARGFLLQRLSLALQLGEQAVDGRVA